MGRIHWIGLGTSGLMLALAGAWPAAAQSLSDGDYDRCAVYRGGDFRGYDSVCLERRRAALRHYRNDDGYGRGWRGGFDTDRIGGVEKQNIGARPYRRSCGSVRRRRTTVAAMRG